MLSHSLLLFFEVDFVENGVADELTHDTDSCIGRNIPSRSVDRPANLAVSSFDSRLLLLEKIELKIDIS